MSNTAARLFDDDVVRSGDPARDTESTFHFLNRADGLFWERVRDELEAWYADYPDATGDLRARFRDPDIRQHVPAWWELYTYRLFRRLGYSVEVHPPVSSSAKKPDFLITSDDAAFYLECAVMFGDEDGSDAQAWVCECINSARNPDFIVNVHIVQRGAQRPRALEITRPIEEWLASLDYDTEGARFNAGAEVSTQVFEIRDWIIRLAALPVREDRRGGDHGRILAIYPSQGVVVVLDTERLRNIFARKGSEYGFLNKPFIVGLLNNSTFTDAHAMTNALFGSIAVSYYPNVRDSAQTVRKRNGYWRQGPPRRGARVSGVLFGSRNLHAWSIARELPLLWVNPWAAHPITENLPFATTTADDDGKLLFTHGSATPQSVFGVPTHWPEEAE